MSKFENVTVCMFSLVVCNTLDLSSDSIGTLDASTSRICSMVEFFTTTFFCASRNFASRALFTGFFSGVSAGVFFCCISVRISSATSLSLAKISVASFRISSSIPSDSDTSGSSSGSSSSDTSSSGTSSSSTIND